MNVKILLVIFIAMMNLSITIAGPIAAGVCYAGCAGLVVSCFSAAGVAFGTIPGAQIATVPALVACNAKFAACEAACMVALAVPAP